MSAHENPWRRRDVLADRALGLGGGAPAEARDTPELESYERAAAALHLALISSPLRSMPEATLRRIEAEAEPVLRRRS